MISDTIRQLNRVTFIHSAVMVLMLGVLISMLINRERDISSLLVALVVYFVLVVAVSILLIVVARRTDKALMREVASASPAIAADRSAHVAPAPAQVVRRRISRKRNAYVAGYAPTSPPAIVMMLRVIAPEGARLAIALAPTSALGNRARSYVGVRLDPAHPDVAVLDSTAAPEAMKTQYESAMALPGFKKPPIGWGSTSLFALCGVAAGLLVGIGAGLLLP